MIGNKTEKQKGFSAHTVDSRRTWMTGGEGLSVLHSVWVTSPDSYTSVFRFPFPAPMLHWDLETTITLNEPPRIPEYNIRGTPPLIICKSPPSPVTPKARDPLPSPHTQPHEKMTSYRLTKKLGKYDRKGVRFHKGKKKIEANQRRGYGVATVAGQWSERRLYPVDLADQASSRGR